MINSVSSVQNANTSPKVNIPSLKNNFGEVLDKKMNIGFNSFISELNDYYGKSFFHVLDTSEISLWDRKDFPKELLFKENCTSDELKGVSLPLKEPANVSYGNITQTHSIAFVISPAAAEKMNSDPQFCEEVMSKIKAEIPQNWYQEFEEDIKEDTTGIMTGCGITIEITENGDVKFNIYTSGRGKTPSDWKEYHEEKKLLRKNVYDREEIITYENADIIPSDDNKFNSEMQELFNYNMAYYISDFLAKGHR